MRIFNGVPSRYSAALGSSKQATRRPLGSASPQGAFSNSLRQRRATFNLGGCGFLQTDDQRGIGDRRDVTEQSRGLWQAASARTIQTRHERLHFPGIRLARLVGQVAADKFLHPFSQPGDVPAGDLSIHPRMIQPHFEQRLCLWVLRSFRTHSCATLRRDQYSCPCANRGFRDFHVRQQCHQRPLTCSGGEHGSA